MKLPDVVDGGSRDHFLRVEDDVGTLLPEEIDADRVSGACDDVSCRVAAFYGLERGEVRVTIVCKDERDLWSRQPLHEARVTEIADEGFVLLVPEIFHALLVLIHDDEVFILLLELFCNVIAGTPTAKNYVLDTFF